MTKKVKNGSNGSPGEGNTNLPKKRASASKKWCFTFNNYKENEIDELIKVLAPISDLYYFCKEVGDSGTPHLQGFVEFTNKQRPMEVCKFTNKIHWEKMKGSIEENLEYCRKTDGEFFTNMKFPRILEDPLKNKKYYDWQQKIIDVIEGPPANNRDVHWFWEKIGNVGKSMFCKHLLIKYDDVALVSGKGADIKYNLISQLKKREINVVLIDIPRVNKDYISYAAIEEIKNGMIVNTKYESETTLFNFPHVFIFANQAPELGHLSEDKLIVHDLNKYNEKDLELVESIEDYDDYFNAR